MALASFTAKMSATRFKWRRALLTAVRSSFKGAPVRSTSPWTYRDSTMVDCSFCPLNTELPVASDSAECATMLEHPGPCAAPCSAR
eukprot:6488718-Pyramimonas_sp.AAC.1